MALALMRKSKPLPPGSLPVVALRDLFKDPTPYQDTRFIIDRVGMAGEIKKAPGYDGYHVKVDVPSGKAIYLLTPTWYGFIISKEMGSELMKDPSYPSRSTVKMTCRLTKGPKPGGEKGRWHVFVEQLDFLDEKGQGGQDRLCRTEASAV